MNIVQQWKQADSDFIRKKVIEHNMEQLPDKLKTSNDNVSFILKNDIGEIIGGITANIYWNHMHIESLWVDKSVREKGFGRELLKRMETYALDKGCRFIFLDTFSFQAPEFYKNNGYEVFGTIEDHPKGFSQYFLYKKFDM
ncbi:GNAT family N-acetyltransferase [Sporosarcina sp. D27]|uniref:GNAT family N-acetyltransferase n=1 Tax=Sporosarcina sp. D27 TaxID=1382305 RepID=UPI0004714B93|nr:GNAT family N-acetyltransferase [Sporosarcina sp. D27]